MDRVKLLLTVIAVAITCATQAAAQGASIAGLIRERDGGPISGASVRLLQADDVRHQSVSDAFGRYEISLNRGDAGRFDLVVERLGYFTFVTTVEITSTGRISRDVELNPRSLVLAPVEVSVARPAQRTPQGPTPGGNEEAWQSFATEAYPLEPGDLARIGGHKPGVLSFSGDGLNLSILGRPPTQNALLLDGSPFGATSLPPEALRSTAIIGSTYDPARGRFTGGQIAATTRAGTNVFGGALRLRLDDPWLQNTGNGSAVPVRQMVDFGGGAGGAVIRDRWFWFAAGQYRWIASESRTLGSLSAEELEPIGINADSLTRFRALTSRLGFAEGWDHPVAQQESRRGSAMIRTDLHLSDSHTVTLRLDGRGETRKGAGTSMLGVTTEGTRSSSWAGGTLVQLSSYVGGLRNEVRIYASRNQRESGLTQHIPTGYVDVRSDLDLGLEGFTTLTFGATPAFGTDGRTSAIEVVDELLIRIRGDDHRIKLGLAGGRESASEELSSNAYGTFSFRSLEDLDAGAPRSFVRTLGADMRAASTGYANAYAGHLWRVASTLWMIYGVRIDADLYPAPPALDPSLEAGFSAYGAGAPRRRVALSPRFGFVFESKDRTAQLHGGAGLFRGGVRASELSEAYAERGQTSGRRQLICMGPAAPAPRWDLYLQDPSVIPSTCQGGMYSSDAPPAAVFEPTYGAAATARLSLGGAADIYRGRHGQASLHFDVAGAIGWAEPTARNVNVNSTPGFVLAEEERPVYAPVAALDPASGVIDPSATRIDSRFGVVRAISGRGRSRNLQATIGTSFLSRRMALLSGYYTFTRSTDAVTGIPAPGGFSLPISRGNPDDLLHATADYERRHHVQIRGIFPVARLLEVGIIGNLTSGEPFTPRIDSDVNGDGLANDAAFIPDPAGRAASAGDLPTLLSGLPPGIRSCLESQSGHIARRNSCRGPWTATLDLQANLRPPRGSRASRVSGVISVTNLLGGLDELLHGRSLRGWGGTSYVDPTLLVVQGFDPDSRSMRYAINPGFGPQSGRRNRFREPFTVTLHARLIIGSDPATQPIRAMVSGIRARGRSVDELRAELSRRVPNLALQVIDVADSLGLRLAEDQQAALLRVADEAGRTLPALADSLAAAVNVAETDGDDDIAKEARARGRVLADRLQQELDRSLTAIRTILAPDQWAMLPEPVRNPGRQLLPDRSITLGGASDSW